MDSILVHNKDKILLDYFNWLTSLVDNPPNGKNYSKLFECLHKYKFKAINNFDKNRQNDAMELRKVYCNSIYYKIYVFSNCPETMLLDDDNLELCTFLELLICLSKRMEFEMTSDSDMDYSMNRWFWELISNIDFTRFDNEYWDELDSEKNIVERINLINERKYANNGYGGLFPTNEPPYNMRKLQLWYQMMKYLQEKYDLEDD